METIYMSNEDLKRMKMINEGTDGVIYKPQIKEFNGFFFKIYKKESVALRDAQYRADNSYKVEYDDEGVNIADNRAFFKKRSYHIGYQGANYYDEDNVKLRAEDAISKAIQKQTQVRLTSLPTACIFIDGRFRGVVIKEHKHTIPIQNIAILPFKEKMRVLRELLDELDELYKNYIYHIDLSVKPITKFREANVLVNISLHPHPVIIDVDGKSAVYTERENLYYYHESVKSYMSLVKQILFDIDVEEIDDDDLDYLRSKLESIQLNKKLIGQIVDSTVETVPDARGFLDEIEALDKDTRKGIRI